MCPKQISVLSKFWKKTILAVVFSCCILCFLTSLCVTNPKHRYPKNAFLPNKVHDKSVDNTVMRVYGNVLQMVFNGEQPRKLSQLHNMCFYSSFYRRNKQTFLVGSIIPFRTTCRTLSKKRLNNHTKLSIKLYTIIVILQFQYYCSTFKHF